MKTLSLTGDTLKPEELFALGTDLDLKIYLSPQAWENVKRSRDFVDELAEKNNPVYGINTGNTNGRVFCFGNFATVPIPKDKLAELQTNLITSHAAGTGAPLPQGRVRMLLALRINVLAKGYSGIRPSTLETMIKCFNLNLLSYVPEQGTVGASGDLAPLSHLALGMIGMGKMFDPETREYHDASVVLKKYNVEPIQLAAKEGLAMINGTQFISSLGAEAVVRAENCVKVADIIGALSLEVLKGTPRAFDAKIHDARPHPGQILSAATVRSLLHNSSSQNQDEQSTLYQSHVHCNRVQDSYTLRCIPQVHGVVHDTLKFVRSVLTTELNSATDNPMIFAEHRDSISGGNFHGEYPAKVLDFLGIAVHELSSISERRIERLVNPTISGLPEFLVEHGGLNSGFMIAHCTAASLVSENKVLCHPSSVDSISTSASKEDHVSMGGFSARKALQIVENVEKVLAIELLCACQGLDFLRPLRTTKRLENVYELVRSSGVEKWDKDRVMYTDIEIAWCLIKNGKVVVAALN